MDVTPEAAMSEPDPEPATRPWWRRLPFLVLVGVLPVPFGLFFLAFVAMGLLLSDRTRETEARAGGSVLLFWWAYSFREGDTTPYLGAVLLLVAAVLLAKVAVRRRARARAAVVPAIGAVGAVALAVAAFVPYGYRAAEVSRDEAVRLVLAERTAHPWRRIAADVYLVEAGRLRFVHTPVWYVAVYERNPDVARTADGQPCFRHREVWRVDALSGDVSRATYDDARVVDDPCLPVQQGTAEHLRPVPSPS